LNSTTRSCFVDQFAGCITGIRRFSFGIALSFGLESLIAPQLSITQSSSGYQPNGSKDKSTEKPGDGIVIFVIGNSRSKKAAWQPQAQQ